MDKNRYADILAPDRTLVHIDGILPYINANYIDLSPSRRMIACQGPIEETTFDFWKMIYYKKVKCILMVTPLVEGYKQKCHKYWPTKNEGVLSLGLATPNQSLTVFTVDEIVYSEDHTVVSKIVILGPHGGHIVHHIYHYDWLDKKDADVYVVMFLLSLIISFVDSYELFVCHCSAGVGRTGVIVATLRALWNDESVITAIMTIRVQRHGLVQNLKQYHLVKNLVTLIALGAE
jgi:protein tyrosine phosphatase